MNFNKIFGAVFQIDVVIGSTELRQDDATIGSRRTPWNWSSGSGLSCILMKFMIVADFETSASISTHLFMFDHFEDVR